MRFDLTPTVRVGDTYTTEKFLWFPVTIGNERRWLEKATIKYVYYELQDPTSGGCKYWKAIEFLNK